MAKKQSAKRAFDWRTYTKPARVLTPAQEESFLDGALSPVLAWAGADPRTRFEIRARAAALYHRGVSLARVTGDGPHEAELEPTTTDSAQRIALDAADDVERFLAVLSERRTGIDASLDAGHEGRNHRSLVASLAAGNAGGDLAGDGVLVVDIEHALGRRKLDLVALVRSEGVTGPGGFANPDLAFIDVRGPGQSLTGPGGLAALADDLADYAKALSGEHVRRSADEVAALTAQKVRLGLLPAELQLRAISDGMPHLVVAFAERDVDLPGDHEAIVELHERLASRHYPTHRLRFVHVTAAPEDGDGLAIGLDDLMDYRAFKAYRRSGG